MLGLRFLGQGRLALEPFPDPQPQGDEVVVRIEAAAICGTDREHYLGAGQPTIPGHESAGQVVAVDKPSWVKVGQRVAINCHVTCGCCRHCLNGDLYFCEQLSVIGFDRHGGFAEYARVPEACCMPLPDHLSYTAGALLTDMFGTAYRAVVRSGLLPGDRVGVWGAGPIGLAAMLVIKAMGGRAALIDLNAYRLDLALRLGADVVINPSQLDVVSALADWTHGEGLDIAYECVGHQACLDQALEAVKKRGVVVLVGVSHRVTIDPWQYFIGRELTMYGTRNFNARQFQAMVKLLSSGLPAEQIVTHRFALSDAEQAFSVFSSAQCGKVVFTASG